MNTSATPVWWPQQPSREMLPVPRIGLLILLQRLQWLKLYSVLYGIILRGKEWKLLIQDSFHLTDNTYFNPCSCPFMAGGPFVIWSMAYKPIYCSITWIFITEYSTCVTVRTRLHRQIGPDTCICQYFIIQFCVVPHLKCNFLSIQF